MPTYRRDQSSALVVKKTGRSSASLKHSEERSSSRTRRSSTTPSCGSGTATPGLGTGNKSVDAERMASASHVGRANGHNRRWRDHTRSLPFMPPFTPYEDERVIVHRSLDAGHAELRRASRIRPYAVQERGPARRRGATVSPLYVRSPRLRTVRPLYAGPAAPRARGRAHALLTLARPAPSNARGAAEPRQADSPIEAKSARTVRSSCVLISHRSYTKSNKQCALCKWRRPSGGTVCGARLSSRATVPPAGRLRVQHSVTRPWLSRERTWDNVFAHGPAAQASSKFFFDATQPAPRRRPRTLIQCTNNDKKGEYQKPTTPTGSSSLHDP